jgi:hypothetical protein
MKMILTQQLEIEEKAINIATITNIDPFLKNDNKIVMFNIKS